MDRSSGDPADTTDPAPTKATRGISLRLRVTLLVTVAILPMLISILVYQALEYKRHVKETGQQSIVLARSMAQGIEQRLNLDIAVLQTLASATSLMSGDLVTFRTRLEGVVASQFPGANIVLMREDGQQLINTRLPADAPLPVRPDIESVKQVFATGKPSVSDFYYGAIGHRPVIAVDVPVFRDGHVIYSLSIDPNLDDLTAAMRRLKFSENWVGVVIDRKGIIIARTRSPELFVGRHASQALTSRAQEATEDTVKSTTIEGIPVLTSFSRVEPFGWTVAIGVPRAELLAPTLAAVRQTLLLGGAVLLVSLGLSLLVARQVTRPMAQLRHLAASVDSGELGAVETTGLPEADEVVHALVGAAIERQRSVAEERRTLAALRESEERLRQSQKMQAVGQLTGGLAHDFNNLLLVIMGNLDMLREIADGSPEIDELASEAQAAAQRGADLTRSLLAFSRRQPLRPQRIDLNDLVARAMSLLNRTLGEQIDIQLDLASDVWSVLVDQAQLTAAITNLATNARDAMPKGGRLMIATSNRTLDQDYTDGFEDVAAGEYAMLQVSDTGMGMTPEILSQIFEPFFTTKGLAEGTGLGLSMVFGFVKQSGGHINVYSEPGVGTTFRLYLPRNEDGAIDAVPDAKRQVQTGRGETVLVVEDNEQLRRLVMRQLVGLGYAALEAADAASALEILGEDNQVDLLFSDVVMGGQIDGLDLARIVSTDWPEVKIVLTSGFPASTASHIAGQGLGDITLLSKPYRNTELARVLRDALGDAKEPVS